MQLSGAPTKVTVPFANSGTKNTIPTASQIGVTPGAASYTDGFPPLTFTPLASGGVPPAGADFNGILNAITQAVRWQMAGGTYAYDSAFSTAVGGYPKGALLSNSASNGLWMSTADNNGTNPDTGGANWASMTGGRLLGFQTFTASGTYTPGTYNGVTATKIRVRGIGGGGAGGSIAFTSTGQAAVAGGGNGGAPGEIMILGSLAASYPVVIGSAGSPGAQGNNPGGAGGTTTFGGTLLTCPGGQGGLGGSAATPPVAIFGNGLINQATSAAPAIAVVLGATPIGDVGAAYSVTSALGGKGASTPYGAGGNGGGGGNGSTSKGYGAGGGGAGQGASSGTGFQGGSGLSGILIVEEYA